MTEWVEISKERLFYLHRQAKRMEQVDRDLPQVIKTLKRGERAMCDGASIWTKGGRKHQAISQALVMLRRLPAPTKETKRQNHE